MKICALLLAVGSFCLAADAPKTFTGTIEDDMCGGDHKKMGGTNAAKCTEDCVKGMGAKYALISGKDVYVLSNQAAAAKYIARKVTITGNLVVDKANKADAKVLNVQKIALAK